MSIKTLFIGSNWESLEVLKTIYEDSRFEVVGIITQPDKPVGRKQILTPTEIKTFGLENDIPVFIPEKNEEKYKEALELFKPDLVVCIAFGEIIPDSFLLAPKYGSINIHFSLLPKYRGAIPIQSAIINGEKETGITIMKMGKGMDKGPILSVFKEQIKPDDTNQSLRERLVKISAEVLPEILDRWVNGEIHAMEQDDSKATYCYKAELEKEKMEIKFDEMTAENIDRIVRGCIPWPVAWTILNDSRIKIYKVRVLEAFGELKPGEILKDRGRLVIGTQDKQIEILELQPEGKNIMNAMNYLTGRKI
ncbi:methionyl-tRNA formyltransferase [Candidatus Dojkabacteria bacterium]|nr:methionyl-tRNA formyltransferase [Candidatus Dojkabacteria bacterium]